MTISDEYQRQFGWRDWNTVLDALPPLDGATVLDLGCGVGDLAAELVARGARVIGFDLNEELLDAARARGLPRSEFRKGDLRSLPELEEPVDGLWCSFAAAYFPDLSPQLVEWGRRLRLGGWIAITEVDDLFGHEPLGADTRARFAAYAADSFAAGRYDFHMGGKLEEHLGRAGFRVTERLTLDDRELSFRGPASPEVVEAWRARLQRMKLLRDFCGTAVETVEAELLTCLAHADHRCSARVLCCMAVK